MEYLQYVREIEKVEIRNSSFKPCYKWNTFNTGIGGVVIAGLGYVLNLVISGIPSILTRKSIDGNNYWEGFKPCYKWNTFNTEKLVKKLKALALF